MVDHHINLDDCVRQCRAARRLIGMKLDERRKRDEPEDGLRIHGGERHEMEDSWSVLVPPLYFILTDFPPPRCELFPELVRH